MVGLGFLPGGNESRAFGVSADGFVVVGYGDNADGDIEAFRWAGGMQGLGQFPGEDSRSSIARAVSADLAVIVGDGIDDDDQDQAFRWVGGGLLPLGGFAEIATGVSADGTYTLVTAASVTGTFDAVEEPPGVALAVSYTATGVEATVTAVTVANEPGADLPDTAALHAAYPNPFDPQAVVPYDVAEAGRVHLAVYDVLGREVAVLVDGERPAGRHEAVLYGRGLAAGTYLVRMIAAGVTHAQRVTVFR